MKAGWHIAILLLFSLPVKPMAQVHPADGARLHYRIIGFSFPLLDDAKEYTIEIASGRITSEDSFTSNIIAVKSSEANRITAEVPSFGKDYTWRVRSGAKKSLFYHFSTLVSRKIDTAAHRLSIIDVDRSVRELFVTADRWGVIYDLSGNPVWFMPDSVLPAVELYDMKFTTQGTITFFCKGVGYEANYDGNILYRMPDHDSICKKKPARYHHEFTRLQNGHYMVMGVEDLHCIKIVTPDTSYIIASVPKPGFRRNVGVMGNRNIATLGTLLEFDENDSLVWSWRSSEYLLHSDFAYYAPIDTNYQFDAHDNAFYFDETNKVIYVGFRNLDRVVKIAYPSRQILASYGKGFRRTGHIKTNDLFCNPHSIGRSPEGDLRIFSNGDCSGNNFLPSVITLHEPASGMDDIRVTHRYVVPSKYAIQGQTDGGNAVDVPGGLTYMAIGGAEYAVMLLVDQNKKIVWSARPQAYDADTKKWITPELYRGNIIDRNYIERMIWQSTDFAR